MTCNLMSESPTYKPFRYPWAFDYWLKQQQSHWLGTEVPLGDDVKDYHLKLTPNERNLLDNVFRFFTQSDVEVSQCYHRAYLKWFKPTEVVMMLTAFSNMETVHMHAYSHLLETVGMDENEYSAFLKIEEMREKHDYLQSVSYDTPYDLAKTMAIFGGFTEGVQLFASFAILLNFPRFNKMKGMGQIVTWSVRDESLHCEGVIRLFKEWLRENPEIDRKRLESECHDELRQIITMEDAFVDMAFEMGGIKGLTAEEVKQYIRHIANMRLRQLGFAEIFEGVERNPLPWLEEILNAPEHVNFFEARATEYSKGAVEGWDSMFS